MDGKLPVRDLSGAHPVQEVDLSLRNLDLADVTRIGTLLKGNTSLTRLNLSGNSLCGIRVDDAATMDAAHNDSGIAALCDSLQESHSMLQVLELEEAQLSSSGASMLITTLKLSNIASLNLSSNLLGGTYDEFGCWLPSGAIIKLLAVAIQESSLTKLDVSRNMVNLEGGQVR